LATAAPVSPKTSPEDVKAFRKRHGLSARAMDRLFGFASTGRATRRWEKEDAPSYVGILMAYFDRHGTKLADQIAKSREEPLDNRVN
jgi:hypothetical protein